MPLTKKVTCPYHDEGAGNLRRELSKCYLCKGTGFIDVRVYLKDYKGKFKKIDDEAVEVIYPDESMDLTCSCGERSYISENDYYTVCSCGRIYKAISKIEVDETYIGRQEELIKLSSDW